MSECTHNCETCGENCSSRDPKSFLEKPHELSHIKKVIGVVSGKGGVGKSLVTSMLAVMSSRAGYKTAILDADITGPSIPKAFGIHEKMTSDGTALYPAVSKTGIEIASINMLLENESDPVVWRGPVIASTVKQFWSDVIWDTVDYMFVDMPPGTGDVPLTVFQSIPLDGIIIVTTPQQLVAMIVEKAANMAKLMNIPILGMVENMSYFVCDECGKKHHIYGESGLERIAADYQVENFAALPMDAKLAAACDKGMIELFDSAAIDAFADKLFS